MSAKTEQVGGSHAFREQSPGWRFLDFGEKVKKGDQFYATFNGWHRTACHGAIVPKGLSNRYRRRIASERGGK